MNRIDQHPKFINDGWTAQEIDQAVVWGAEIISQAEATQRLGYNPPSGGLWFPHSDTWGQLRPDVTTYANGQPVPKYLGPKGSAAKSLWLPGVTECQWVTEGWSDAALGTMRGGISIGAIAGVSHYATALTKGSGLNIIFDSDAWKNCDVMRDLIRAGMHTGGKVAIVPLSPESKAGLTEWANDTGEAFPQALREALDKALWPKDLFRQWLEFLVANPLAKIKNADTVADLYRKVAKLGQWVRVNTKRWQAQHWAAHRKAYNRRLEAEQVIRLADAPIGEFDAIPVATGDNRKLIALNGTVGTAKTSKGLFGAVASALGHGQRALIVASSQALCGDIKTRLSAYLLRRGITSPVATHLDENAGSTDILITCGESLHKAIDRHWPLVCWDEPNKSIPRLILGILGNAPKLARAAMVKVCSAARTIVMAQDSLYQAVLDAVQRMAAMAAEQVDIIRRRRAPADMEVRLYPDFPTWAHDWRKAHTSGEKVATSMGGQEKGRHLEQWLNATAAETDLVVIDRPDTDPALRADVMANPDAWINTTQPDGFMFSPTMNEGVSIEQPYFTCAYEYATPFETASNTLQRGARVRAALGGQDGALKYRALFMNQRGLATQPHSLPWETFTPSFWQTVLQEETPDAIADRLRPLGLDGIARRALADRVSLAAEFPEVATMLAIEAREVYFKPECLTEAYEAAGYTLTSVEPLDEETAATITAELAQAREVVMGRHAQTLSHAPTLDEARQSHPAAVARFDQGQDPANPTEGRWFEAWRIEQKLGTITQLNDPQFWAACHLDKRGYLAELQLRAALDLAWNYPQQFAEFREWAALAIVAPDDAPALPLPAKVLEQAAILSPCPGLQDAAEGRLSTWDKDTPQVQRAHQWAVANALRLARCSRHSQRIYGLQFTTKTYAVAAFNKLLGMVGIEAMADGQRGRIWQYRAKTVADAEALLATQGRPQDERALYRIETLPILTQAIQSTALDRAALAAQDWIGLLERLSPPAQNFSREESISTEVLCTPSESPSTARFRPGERVRKRGVNGWSGLFVALDRAGLAIVRWFGDAADSLISLDALEGAG